ncbi:Uncharacterised protein [Tatumella ptyseos]|uniref:Uncharacterized protein n=1 Tax=Tatumella ptyseos TaxID=82987 RepID=A0A2X5NH00_9GAMM|nr:Uncharacterised protein [Tatumella ptyseos]
MQILSHRGLWTTAEEKNSLQAFCQSFSAGFGTETDVRIIAENWSFLMIFHTRDVFY